MTFTIIEAEDMFASGAELLVNTVNTVGTMGGGLAAKFKKNFPECNTDYIIWCNQKPRRGGDIHLYHHQPYHLWIANFATKEHWREPSNYEYVARGLDTLYDIIITERIGSVAIPALGCGLGGLDWEIVKEMIADMYLSLPDGINVKVYAPQK